MDNWLQQNLVCPRDKQPFELQDDKLCCTNGHAYPIYDGIPVLVLNDVEQTLWLAQHSLDLVHGKAVLAPELQVSSDKKVHPHVQKAIGATNGILYVQQISRLQSYPIPEIRLPPGHGQRLLDLGCNWGRWSVAAAQKGYQPIGIDPSLEAILAARHVSRQCGVNCSFVVADARYLPFKANSFEVTFSYSVLQHMSDENVQLVLQEVQRVLTPQGSVLIQMANMYGIRCLYHQLRRGFRQARDFEVRYRTPEKLAELFTTVGSATLSVDGFFGLGIQRSDLHLMPPHYQALIITSELLRAMSAKLPLLTQFADSLYVHADNTAV